MKLSGYGFRRAWRRAAEIIDGTYAHSLRLMERGPARRVLVSGIYRETEPIHSLVQELRRSAHDLTFALGAMGAVPPELTAETRRSDMRAGKFQNLNELTHDAGQFDWLLIVDDDVTLPPRFLDHAIELAERLDLALAQPAQTRLSNANWPVTRRHLLTLARRTEFVEVGPVTLLRADAVQRLLPFPADLRYGWGLDFHWAQQMRDANLGMGVLDGVAVIHSARKVASTYSWQAAQDEGRLYLAGVPHRPNTVAQGHGLKSYRTIPRRA